MPQYYNSLNPTDRNFVPDNDRPIIASFSDPKWQGLRVRYHSAKKRKLLASKNLKVKTVIYNGVLTAVFESGENERHVPYMRMRDWWGREIWSAPNHWGHTEPDRFPISQIKWGIDGLAGPQAWYPFLFMQLLPVVLVFVGIVTGQVVGGYWAGLASPLLCTTPALLGLAIWTWFILPKHRKSVDTLEVVAIALAGILTFFFQFEMGLWRLSLDSLRFTLPVFVGLELWALVAAPKKPESQATALNPNPDLSKSMIWFLVLVIPFLVLFQLGTWLVQGVFWFLTVTKFIKPKPTAQEEEPEEESEKPSTDMLLRELIQAVKQKPVTSQPLTHLAQVLQAIQDGRIASDSAAKAMEMALAADSSQQ